MTPINDTQGDLSLGFDNKIAGKKILRGPKFVVNLQKPSQISKLIPTTFCLNFMSGY